MTLTTGSSGNQNDKDEEEDSQASSVQASNVHHGRCEDDETAEFRGRGSSRYRYNWRYYVPKTSNCFHIMTWFMVGGAAHAEPQSEEEMEESLQGLARCLLLIRKYLSLYGLPDNKDLASDQEFVLKEVCRDLYAGGAPLWALEPVMQKAAEGLTGERHVNWMLFPRKAYIYNPSVNTTSMFKISRGFNIRKLDAMEKVAVRLATFASNVQAVVSIPERLPNLQEFEEARQSVTGEYLQQDIQDFKDMRHRASAGSVADPNNTTTTNNNTNDHQQDHQTRLANRILNLASGGKGLFYFVNSREYREEDYANTNPLDELDATIVREFWTVTKEERELFMHLACDEAFRTIGEIDKAAKQTRVRPWMLVACRAVASIGTCAFWFNGGWWDMLVAGLLAIFVSLIGTSSFVSKQERLIYEVVASAIVGLISGVIALRFPDHTCYSSMSIAGVLDLMQGFGVVYSIIEIMSKHTVSGVADLFESVLFTELIAYFLWIGRLAAIRIMITLGKNSEFQTCPPGINPRWYILFMPLGGLAWSALFNPSSCIDLGMMTFHAVLAYSINYGLSDLGLYTETNSMISACAVSFSAGIHSRFTGKQAVGNASAGMYALVPGAYVITIATSSAASKEGSEQSSNFFSSIISHAIAIGIGGWTGTILCSPAVLGTTRGLIGQQNYERLSQHASKRMRQMGLSRARNDISRVSGMAPGPRDSHEPMLRF